MNDADWNMLAWDDPGLIVVDPLEDPRGPLIVTGVVIGTGIDPYASYQVT